MSASVTLSQDQASVLPGINLNWAYANLGAIREISLIYTKMYQTPILLLLMLPPVF